MIKKLLLISLFFALWQNAWAEEEPTPTKIGPSCTFGTTFELDLFFARKNLVQIAKGTRRSTLKKSHDNVEVLFLLSKDMEYFHVVTLKPEHGDNYRACFISSAREIDLQIEAPVANFLARKPREHLLFLNDVPKDGTCPIEKNNCSPWVGPSEFIGVKYLLTAYLYSEHWHLDAYTQIVDINIDKKTIQPTRGMLSEFVRLKYASRLRNEFDEDAAALTAAKEAYRNIYDEIDHEHPLYMFITGENGTWEIRMIDRYRGVIWAPIRGDNLEIFPLSKREYRELRDVQ